MNKLCAVILCVLFSGIGAAQDWPQFRGPNRDGVSTEKDWLAQWPAQGLKRLWKTPVGTGSSSVAVSQGSVFTMGHSADTDYVYCLNAETGQEVWKYSYPCETFDNMHEGGPSSTPAVDGKSVYTLGRGGQLNCLDAASGKLIWGVDFTQLKGSLPMFGHSNSPLIAGDAVIVSVGGPGISRAAFDKKTGKILWQSGDDDASYASPMPVQVDKKSCVALFNASGLVIVDLADGAEIGRHGWVTPSPVNSRINAATPLICNAGIFITSGYGKGCAMLSLAGGKPGIVWENQNLRSQYGTPVLYDGYIYGFDSSPDGGDRQGSLKCIDAKTGDEKWVRNDPALGTLMVADGRLLIVSRRGELILAEATPEKYKELSRMQVFGGICRTEPVLANGRIYVRSVTGDLVCLDARK